MHSTGVESPQKLVALEAKLHEAENRLTVTSSEHEEILHVLENIKHSQLSSQQTVDLHL